MVERPSRWRAGFRREVSRRALLRVSALAGGAAAAAAIIGCDDGEEPGSVAPAPGGTLRYGTSLPIAFGLDPHVEQATGLAIFPKVYGYLLHVDPDDESVIYDHATQVEQPDEVTYVFTLRDDVRFQDVAPAYGGRVEAEDVVRSFDRFRNNQLVVNKTWHETILDTIEALDAHTVRVRLHRPSVYTLPEIGGIAAGAILPREVVNDGLPIDKSGAGSGPFRIEAVDLDRNVRVRRNETYYGRASHVDAMEWTIFTSDDAKLRAFEAREVDAIPNRDSIEARQAQELSEDVEVTAEGSLAYLSLGLRVDRPPFLDERVRKAIDLLIDRSELIRELVGGNGDILGPINGRLSDGFWSLPRAEIETAWGEELGRDERIAEAGALLSAANAERLEFPLQVRDSLDLRDVASLLQAQLERGGVRARVEPLPDLTWFLNFRTGQFTSTLISQLPYESPDMPTRLYHSKGIDGSGSTFGFTDPAIDWLVEKSWGEQDRELRRETLLDAQRRMIEARPMLQLFTGTAYSSAWNYVRNRPAEQPGSLRQYHYLQWLDDDAPTRQQV